MSKGLGVWQRALLAVLEKQHAVVLTDMLARGTSRRTQYAALHRAASTLFEQGKVQIMHGQRKGRAWVTLPGHECDLSQVPRLKTLTK